LRSGTVVTRFICGVAFLWTLGWGSPVHAQLGVGEVRTDAAGPTVEDTLAAGNQKVIETWVKK
jgi:hypothetical protein